MQRSLLVLLVLSAAVSSAWCCDEWIVAPDGSGDFTDLGSALEAADDGDVIRMRAGRYHQFVLVEKSLTIESESGLPDVYLDGEGTSRLMDVSGPLDLRLSNLQFVDAHGDGPSALLIWNQARVVLYHCKFRDNDTIGSNAVHVRHAGTEARFLDCRFEGNVASQHSAALSASMGASIVLDGCILRRNTASGTAGAMNVLGATVEISRCVFQDNRSTDGVGALRVAESVSSVKSSTFHANVGSEGAVRLGAGTFEGNIVTGTGGGTGLMCAGSVLHAANLYDGNAGGPIIGDDLHQSEIRADPLFCGPESDDLTLCDLSPALAAINGVADMGALGVGCSSCGGVSNEQMTWGGLKSVYR